MIPDLSDFYPPNFHRFGKAMSQCRDYISKQDLLLTSQNCFFLQKNLRKFAILTPRDLVFMSSHSILVFFKKGVAPALREPGIFWFSLIFSSLFLCAVVIPRHSMFYFLRYTKPRKVCLFIYPGLPDGLFSNQKSQFG
jgi:hypothetical protein